eukprot:365253-Chlamydomonas_euryale.AAC.17
MEGQATHLPSVSPYLHQRRRAELSTKLGSRGGNRGQLFASSSPGRLLRGAPIRAPILISQGGCGCGAACGNKGRMDAPQVACVQGQRSRLDSSLPASEHPSSVFTEILCHVQKAAYRPAHRHDAAGQAAPCLRS